ncbi:major facilitator superfamily transporter [Acetobacter orleanensis NRIC 0473]|nr:major facilitator superfamily transporter [Acetobacter orleanensis NRIC 0473]
MTILHVAVPKLTQSLNASGTEVLWIIDIYPLLMAGLLVPMGTLADRVGNRTLLLLGLIVFGLASAFAAFAQSALMLIAARIFLALGGSMIVPCVLGLIRKTFEDEAERATALGVWGMVGAAGAAVGPLVGGSLLEHFWWGAVFLINVPAILLVAPACYFLLPRREKTTPGKWSVGQSLLLIAGILSLVYSIKTAAAEQHLSITIGLVAAFGVVCLALFARKQLRSPTPMLDLSLLSHPAIIAGLLMSVIVSGALAGVELTLAQEMQYVLGMSPLQAGIFMVPIMVAAAIGSPVAGYLSNRFGLRLVATLSLIVSAAALLFLALKDFHTPGFWVPFALAALGLALSIGLTASSIAIMSSVDASKGGAAGALEATGYELGSGLGITMFGVFMSGVFSHIIKLPASLPTALAQRSARTIGDSYIVAAELPASQGTALVEAAKAAFTKTHAILLTTSAGLIALLAVVVFVTLANYRSFPSDPS